MDLSLGQTAATIGDARYLELDASFRALHLPCDAVPLAVVWNYIIPFGWITTLSEQAASYELLYCSIMNINDELAMWKPSVKAEGSEPSEWMSLMQVLRDLPVLGNVGAGLVAKSYWMKHYLCFRHILESMGTETYVAVLARHLLFSSTEREYRG
jgi:hypothetical protein